MAILSSEGKIEVPKSVLRVLRISPGDEIDFQISGKQVLLCKKPNDKKSLRKYLGYLSNLKGISPDKVVEELRGSAHDIGR